MAGLRKVRLLSLRPEHGPVMFRRGQLKEGKLFLRRQKTRQPVWMPPPKKVITALKACDEGNEHFFNGEVASRKAASRNGSSGLN